MSALKFAACGGTPLYVDDVFSAYTRTGTGASATVTTGIDLSTYGGMVWPKSRSAATGHRLMHTAIGVGNKLVTDTTAASAAAAQGVTAVSTTGHTIGTDTDYNTNAATYVDWVFRNATKFYTHSVVTKSAGSNATVNLSTLGTVGMVRVKRTDSTGSWYIWHRSLTAGKLLIGETTAAEATLGHITVSGTTVTLVNGVIADGTYLVEGFAHDTSATGIIQCFTHTTNASGIAAVNLGFESQFLMIKQITGAPGAWLNFDSARPLTAEGATGSAKSYALISNSSVAENGPYDIQLTSIGFVDNAALVGTAQTFVGIAIRRPNKPPTSGTQVYNAIARTGTGAAATVTGVGFAPDLVIAKDRGIVQYPNVWARLIGLSFIDPSSVGSESSYATGITAYSPDGVSLGTDAATIINTSARTYINHFFRRAPGVFDQICTTGTGANKTEAHNLTVVPELWLHKGRSGATQWVWGSSLLANTQKIVMPSPNGVVTDATAWNSTYPTASVISFGTAAAVNTNTATYTTYLWATLAGISKVGLYTGNGASLTVNCGFAAGARFVMIIRTTAATAQDIFIWDTVRGIIAGNDPHLSLNTTAAEITTDDSIDPDTSGFIVNELAATHINVSGADYLYLAYA